METRQEPRKQKDPPAREKSFQDLKREKIYADYRKLHPEEVVIDDPDDPRYYMDADEIREFEKKKLEAEEGKTWLDHSQETRARIEAKHTPEPEEVEPDYDDGRPVAYRALDLFIQRNPQFAKERNFKELTNTAIHSMHPDIFLLREKFNRTGNREDADALFRRAAEIAPGEKAEKERAAYVRSVMRSRSPMDENAVDARIKKSMKEVGR